MSEPTDLDRLAPWLRRRVAELRSSTLRRSFPISVEVVPVPGDDSDAPDAPDDRRTHRPDGGPLDRGLQVDLLCRLMAGADVPVAVIVVRPGHHAAHTDTDGTWAAAARAAADVCGLPLAGAVVVSRWGWLDLLSERRRDWRRLRIRSG